MAFLLSSDTGAAFDTLNHERLVSWPVEFYRLLRLFRLGRLLDCQATAVSSPWNAIIRTSWIAVCSGAPQKPLLGPFLFAIFTNPVGQLGSNFGFSYHQYTDDLQLYKSLNVYQWWPGYTFGTCRGTCSVARSSMTCNLIYSSRRGTGHWLSSAGHINWSINNWNSCSWLNGDLHAKTEGTGSNNKQPT
jgi:hypothetical protein